MRRIVVVLVWLAAVASVVIAIGMRVRATRLADPVQTLRGYLFEVPPELARIATIVVRDKGSLQIEIRANAKWIGTFAEHNHFTPVDGALSGLAADRWMLLDSKKKGAVLHLLRSYDDQPALLTIIE